MRFSKFWNTFFKMSKLTAWISWRIESLSCSIVLGVFLYTLPFSRPPKERSRQTLDRLPLVSNFVTNFCMQHFDGARLSPNSVRNAVWHALNEPVCQYLRTRDSPCINYLLNHNERNRQRKGDKRRFHTIQQNNIHTKFHKSRSVDSQFPDRHIPGFW